MLLTNYNNIHVLPCYKNLERSATGTATCGYHLWTIQKHAEIISLQVLISHGTLWLFDYCTLEALLLIDMSVYCVFRILICRNCPRKKNGGFVLFDMFSFIEYSVKSLHDIYRIIW